MVKSFVFFKGLTWAFELAHSAWLKGLFDKNGLAALPGLALHELDGSVHVGDIGRIGYAVARIHRMSRMSLQPNAVGVSCRLTFYRL